MSFLFISKTFEAQSLHSTTAANAKISVFVICVEAIIYLLCNLHDCTYKRIASFKLLRKSEAKACGSVYFWYIVCKLCQLKLTTPYFYQDIYKILRNDIFQKRLGSKGVFQPLTFFAISIYIFDKVLNASLGWIILLPS